MDHAVSHRSSSFNGPKSFVILRFRHFALCILHFELPLRHYPPDHRGSSCPLRGPRSGARNSRRFRSGHDVRSCPRSGPMTYPRSGVHSSGGNGSRSGIRTCTLSFTRPSYRNSRRSGGRDRPRTRACSELRNSDRYGHRNGACSGSCFGATRSARSEPCPAPQAQT